VIVNSGAQTIEFADGSAGAPSITNSGDTNTGIFFPAADTIAFAEGGTEAMRLDSSGNVGIGTTSPQTPLDVARTAATGTATTALTLTNLTDTTDNGIRLAWRQSGQPFETAWIGTLRSSDASATSNLVFATSSTSWASGAPTERMRITPSGNVLVGATSNPSLSWTTANKLYVDQSTADFVCHIRNSNTTTTNNYGLAISYAATPNNTGQAFIDIRDSTAQRLQVRSNGGIANFSANNVNLSDEREKKDIQLAGSYLDKICAIPVKTFLFNDQTDTDINLGVIAQDVQAVAPELVSESNWGTEEEPKERLSIYQTDLQYALMKCIQEQQTIINDIKAELDNVKTELATLKGAA
jgi:hypothetical protein